MWPCTWTISPDNCPGRNLDIYAADLERIEVLEGPQGTLFGAGAQAGVVRYITNKPKLDVTEANFNAGYATTATAIRATNIDATINVPLIADNLAARAVRCTTTAAAATSTTFRRRSAGCQRIGCRQLFRRRRAAQHRAHQQHRECRARSTR